VRAALISVTGITALAACEPAQGFDASAHLTRFVEGCIQTAPNFDNGRAYFQELAENPDAAGEYLSEYVLPATYRTTAYFVDIEFQGERSKQCILEVETPDRLDSDLFATIAMGIAAYVPKGATKNLGCENVSDACEWEWRAGDDAQMIRVARNVVGESPAYFYTHYYTTVGFYGGQGS